MYLKKKKKKLIIGTFFGQNYPMMLDVVFSQVLCSNWKFFTGVECHVVKLVRDLKAFPPT